MAVISKTDTENRQSTSKGPSKPTHTVGLDNMPCSIAKQRDKSSQSMHTNAETVKNANEKHIETQTDDKKLCM